MLAHLHVVRCVMQRWNGGPRSNCRVSTGRRLMSYVINHICPLPLLVPNVARLITQLVVLLLQGMQASNEIALHSCTSAQVLPRTHMCNRLNQKGFDKI